jgi:phasin family protein
MIMLYPNDLFTNMVQNFSFINNPFMNALKSGTHAAASEMVGVTEKPAGASEIVETLRQTLQDQVKLMNSIASCALASTEKLVELNLNAARTSMQENSTLASQVLALNSTTDLQTIFAALPQATSTKAIAYSHHLADITADACTEIARSTQTQVTQITDRMTNLIDQASRSMPAGSESVVALTKSAIATAGSGVEQVAKTAEQAAHTIQESAESIVNDAVQRNAKTTSSTASRRPH